MAIGACHLGQMPSLFELLLYPSAIMSEAIATVFPYGREQAEEVPSASKRRHQADHHHAWWTQIRRTASRIGRRLQLGLLQVRIPHGGGGIGL